MDRDTKGRFVKGNKAAVGGGGGRPRRSIEEKYLHVLSSRVKIKDWREVIGKAIEQAKDGDSRARQWLSDYLIGKPTQYVSADLTVGDDSYTDEQNKDLILDILAAYGIEIDTDGRKEEEEDLATIAGAAEKSLPV